MITYEKNENVKKELLYVSHIVVEKTKELSYTVVKDKYNVVGIGNNVSKELLELLISSDYRVAVFMDKENPSYFANYDTNNFLQIQK